MKNLLNYRLDLTHDSAYLIFGTRNLRDAIEYLHDQGLTVSYRYDDHSRINLYFNSAAELLVFRLKYSEYL